MDKIEARFRVVTPMFISGADQTKAELRVSSIKGALRFWWRALNYEENPKKLLDEESKIFGSTDGQSKVKIRLKDVEVNPKKIQRKWDINDWKSYVGYGLSEDQSGKEHLNIFREYIEPGGIFSLIFRSNDEISKIFDSLKLFSLLGNLGSRSRKGWGSISIVSINLDWNIPKTRNEYKKQLGELLAFSNNEPDGLPKYSALSSDSIVRIGPVFNTSNEALKDVGEKYKYFLKEKLKPDEREGFGLPRKGVSTSKRRGSPLFIHIHQCENEYFWVCVFLKSIFSENDEEPRCGYGYVEEFMDHIGGDRI